MKIQNLKKLAVTSLLGLGLMVAFGASDLSSAQAQSWRWDRNRNGVNDRYERRYDRNRNGIYDRYESRRFDRNRNGIYDRYEYRRNDRNLNGVPDWRERNWNNRNRYGYYDRFGRIRRY